LKNQENYVITRREAIDMEEDEDSNDNREVPTTVLSIAFDSGKLKCAHHTFKRRRALLDTGSSASLVKRSAVPENAKKKTGTKKTWRTSAGIFYTKELVEVAYQLPDFTTNRNAEGIFHIMPDEGFDYDVLMG
jgi:hypothetical protein